ncbi:maleylpyruvate isomerase family mycothiol-dependent enzyme [Mycobacteroides abscessus subsp. bolletii]|uniref:maleylpyruvate isomerase family mycothiol-dependent enzyme n=1 Tax=Mycobacteroides abscessus TaxID=36809 RepID=UPI0019D1B6E8|nr:maleylpyruvate isomerase family mycothiol-dependent enzyme [Mycobacteroides abscessus]MBN7303156.1 maleylpyruvate isomerase family mycothiol-dependent enzyme [Mycobacteroides abscessus subsp. bolletii]
MSRDNVRTVLTQERRDLAALLRELSPEEWEAESLCTRWRVRDVVAHLLYEATPIWRYSYEVIRARGSEKKLNDMYVGRALDWPTDRLITAFESTIAGGLGAKLLPYMSLTDLLIHHQDIRRPLGRPRTVPESTLRTVLTHPDPFIGSRQRMQGIRWVATDIDWAYGSGPEILGPGEAIVMAVAARPSALPELSGPGVARLLPRLPPVR